MIISRIKVWGVPETWGPRKPRIAPCAVAPPPASRGIRRSRKTPLPPPGSWEPACDRFSNPYINHFFPCSPFFPSPFFYKPFTCQGVDTAWRTGMIWELQTRGTLDLQASCHKHLQYWFDIKCLVYVHEGAATDEKNHEPSMFHITHIYMESILIVTNCYQLRRRSRRELDPPLIMSHVQYLPWASYQ
jgi:hypothetical protein